MTQLPSLELDRVLAHDPVPTIPALAHPAARRVAPSSRRTLAKRIERLPRRRSGSPRARCYAPERLNRAEVVRARSALAGLAQALRSERCDARAAATASWLLRHPYSPLYEPRSAPTLASVEPRATNSR